MNRLVRFMSWARGHQNIDQEDLFDKVFDEPDSLPNFNNLTKEEIVSFVSENYNATLPLRYSKQALVKHADAVYRNKFEILTQ
jgi:hypothetical protein